MPKITTSRLIHDPSMTDSEFLHQKNLERERAQIAGVKPNLNVGKVWAEENVVTRLGALCFIRPPRRQPHHEAAAERFKSLYEARYGIGNPAIDAGRPIVDNSPIAHDSGMAAKIDRTVALEVAEDSLGRESFNRLVALLVLEIPAGEGEPQWRKRKDNVDQVLADLDNLAAVWGYGRKAA